MIILMFEFVGLKYFIGHWKVAVVGRLYWVDLG